MISLDALIKRSEMLDAVDNLHIISCYNKLGKDITEDIRCQFLGTVLKVKPHVGRWIHFEGGYSDHYECTACGRDIVITGRWEFCPLCGAKMDGERKE